MNISETSWPIKINFHLEHHLGKGKAALGFGPDRIRALVSMVMSTIITSRTASKFSKIRLGTMVLAALEHLEKSP